MGPRALLGQAPSARPWVIAIAVIGTLQAFLIVGQAGALAAVIVGAFEGGRTLPSLTPALLALIAFTTARVGGAWVSEWASNGAAAAAKADLRRAAITAILDESEAPTRSGAAARAEGADLSLLLTRGIDALDPWFARFLPQLVLTVSVPLIVGLAIAMRDLVSAVIVVLTLPLIPLFAWLIGTYTRDRTTRQWSALSTLAGRFGDLMTGLPTLLVLGRAREQVAVLRAADNSYRRTTLGVLRVSFLSSLWLELLSSLSVALVAVTIGLRLVNGDMTLLAGLTVLILIPEVYLPMRAAGAQFHAAAEGTQAVRALRDRTHLAASKPGEPTTSPRRWRCEAAPRRIEVHGATVDHGRRLAPAGVRCTLRAGEVTVIIGPSGSGKTTLLRALLGLQALTDGEIRLHPASGTTDGDAGVALTEVDLPDYWRHVGWVPQHPQTLAPTIRATLALAGPVTAASGALQSVGMTDLISRLDDPIGEDGLGLSTGQRRRLALARILIQQPGILIVDEPTASLDDLTEGEVTRALRQQAAQGAIVVVATHRPETAAHADVVIDLPEPRHD